MNTEHRTLNIYEIEKDFETGNSNNQTSGTHFPKPHL